MRVNFHLSNRPNKKGEKLVNPKEKENFEIRLDKEVFQWRLPLGALLPPRYCPTDDEELSGAWNYCPYHGKALKETK